MTGDAEQIEQRPLATFERQAYVFDRLPEWRRECDAERLTDWITPAA
jgi:hypothetical protein